MQPLAQISVASVARNHRPPPTLVDEGPERARRELDPFVHAVTHDLREPLRSIATYAGFLREDYDSKLDEEGREMLAALPRLTRQAEAMIDGLRRYVLIGRSQLEPVETDMAAMVEGVVATLQPLLEPLGVEVRIHHPLPAVACDRALGEELFSQLISNAATFDDRRGEDVGPKYIEIGASADRDPPIFYVRDQGIGITERHQTAIFEVFKRLHPRDRYGGGSGVGLTLAERIVERHGGRIWVDSQPGEGATFFFTLQGSPLR